MWWSGVDIYKALFSVQIKVSIRISYNKKKNVARHGKTFLFKFPYNRSSENLHVSILKIRWTFIFREKNKREIKNQTFYVQYAFYGKKTWDHTIHACLCANMPFGVLLFSSNFLYSWWRLAFRVKSPQLKTHNMFTLSLLAKKCS